MSRVIKFRAWIKSWKKMVMVSDINFFSTNDYAIESIGIVEHHSQAGKNDYELMQFSGLKDKNGKEIYEGDIIGSNMNGQRQCHEVRWVDESAKWSMYWYDDPEIIGNIYENLELLERI